MIELPSDDDSSNDDSPFGGRIDLYEAYWLYVDGVRCVGPVLKQSAAKKKDTDRSPLARHYNHFYEKKEEHKQKCSDLPGNLPKYKEHFEEPRGDVRKIPDENLEELGIGLEEGDDPIWLPPEYELPSVWDQDVESMDRAELQDRISQLRSENRELREERDELEKKLASVGKSLSDYLETQQGNGDEQTKPEADSPLSCELCGESFETKSAKYGHKPHCDGSKSSDDRDLASSANELEMLADELPELNEKKSSKHHENISAEEELKNLNHLLNNSL